LTGALIAEIEKDSLAEELGLAPGDSIRSVNGKKVSDLIQFQNEWAGEEVVIEVEKQSGELLELEIEKGYDEPPGIVFQSAVFDRIRTCANRCLFCFVDQMPPRMRRSLYIKDDDYRLSFLQGSYITLTNLTGRDISRIKREHLSPLYVSVHATEPDLRSRLLQNSRAADVLAMMRELSEAGIEFHTQVVLCPGLNDGEHLERTYRDLAALDGVLSLAVVPVGLTKHRGNLPALRGFDRQQARDLVRWVKEKQRECRFRKKTAFVWLSDEFYLTAGLELPLYKEYEDFPQLENGVGMVRLFWQEFGALTLPEEVQLARQVTIVTGLSGARVFQPLLEKLTMVRGLTLELRALENTFFGPSVTVAGLLTGSCLLAGLQGIAPGSKVLIPAIMQKTGEGRFLDDLTTEEVAAALAVDLVPVPVSAGALVAEITAEQEVLR
jgi:putative radical SAM enzyme (TIGR03279 family)